MTSQRSSSAPKSRAPIRWKPRSMPRAASPKPATSCCSRPAARRSTCLPRPKRAAMRSSRPSNGSKAARRSVDAARRAAGHLAGGNRRRAGGVGARDGIFGLERNGLRLPSRHGVFSQAAIAVADRGAGVRGGRIPARLSRAAQPRRGDARARRGARSARRHHVRRRAALDRRRRALVRALGVREARAGHLSGCGRLAAARAHSLVHARCRAARDRGVHRRGAGPARARHGNGDAARVHRVRDILHRRRSLAAPDRHDDGDLAGDRLRGLRQPLPARAHLRLHRSVEGRTEYRLPHRAVAARAGQRERLRRRPRPLAPKVLLSARAVHRFHLLHRRGGAGPAGYAVRRGAVLVLRLSRDEDCARRAGQLRVLSRQRLHRAHRHSGVREHRRRDVVLARHRRAAAVHFLRRLVADRQPRRRRAHLECRPPPLSQRAVGGLGATPVPIRHRAGISCSLSACHGERSRTTATIVAGEHAIGAARWRSHDMRVVITGGGTGGHVYPGLAIEAALRADAAARGEDYRAIFIGNRSGLEATVVPQSAGLPVAFVPAAPMSRRNPLRFSRGIAINLAGVAVAVDALNRYKPGVVIASGGYVTFPVVAAAWLLRAMRRIDPVIALLEPNAKPGLTNRVLAPLVDEVWCAPWTSANGVGKHGVVTGVPVRAQFKALPPRPRARESFSIDPHATVIVVLGGSQGARSINEAVLSMLTTCDLPREWWILHVSGRRDAATMDAGLAQKRTGNRVTLLPYLDDLWTAYAAADLVVARAGASTLGELAVSARPAVLVPYPYAAEDHQTANAEAFADSGAAKVLADGMLSGENLFRALSNALQPDTLASMAKAAQSLAPADAAAMIVRRVRALRDERTRL